MIRPCVNCGVNQTHAEDGLCAPCASVAVVRAEAGEPLTLLSDLLRVWCEEEGLPLGCADEMRTTMKQLTLAQRDWLNYYCLLWDATEARS